MTMKLEIGRQIIIHIEIGREKYYLSSADNILSHYHGKFENEVCRHNFEYLTVKNHFYFI